MKSEEAMIAVGVRELRDQIGALLKRVREEGETISFHPFCERIP
jgi:hypothetical protein